MTEQYVQDLFGSLTDEEILARIKSGLTAPAYQIACRELQNRGVPLPAAKAPAEPEPPPYLGDMVILARNLDLSEVHILVSRLKACGIHADAGDVNTARINWLWFPAIGGAKIRVPQSQLAQARQILQACQRGEFALGDDFDTGNKVE